MKGSIKHIINRSLIYSILLAGLFQTSCTKESQNDDDTNIPANEGEAYFSMSIDAGKVMSMTRAGDEKGDPEELKVHSVRVVLYDGENHNSKTCPVEYAFEFDVRTPDSWNDTNNTSGWIEEDKENGQVTEGVITPSGKHLYQGASNDNFHFITFAQKVKKKPYKMLVIVNGKDVQLSGDDKSIYDITKKGFFEKQLYEAVSPGINSANGVITGNKGILMTNHQGLKTVNADDLKATAKEANENPVRVNVDRMVAKITLDHTDEFAYPKGIVEGSERWTVDITNKKMFWMRAAAEGDPASSNSMSQLYAEDPNYDKAFNTKIEKANNFNYVRTLDDTGIIINPDKVSNEFKEYQYILENTFSESAEYPLEKFKDQITNIIVGYKYVPKGFKEGDNYYIFNNYAISQDYMDDLTDNDNPIAVPEELKGIKDVIASIENNPLYKLDGTGTDYFEVNKLRYCPKGQLFYSFPIRHFNKPEGSLGYYGVVRNNIYDVQINSLTPPGPTGSFLSGNIVIQPWDIRDKETVIGIEVNEEKSSIVKIYYKEAYYQNWNLYPYYVTEDRQATKPEYRVIERPVGLTINSADFKVDMESIGYKFYSSTPVSLNVNEDPDLNILTLYYSTETISTITISSPILVFFVDTNGKMLYPFSYTFGSNTKDCIHEVDGLKDKNTGIVTFHVRDMGLYNTVMYDYRITDQKNGYGNVYEPILDGSNRFEIYKSSAMPTENTTISFGDPISKYDPIQLDSNIPGYYILVLKCRPKN